MKKMLLKRTLLVSIGTLLLVLLCLVLSFLVSKKYNYNIDDVLGIEGILFLIISAYSFFTGTSFSGAISSVPDLNNAPASYDDVENYAKDKQAEMSSSLKNNFMPKITLKTQILLLSGFIITLISYFYNIILQFICNLFL